MKTSKYKNQIALYGKVVARDEEEMRGMLDQHGWKCRVIHFNGGVIIHLDWEDVDPDYRQQYFCSEEDLEEWVVKLPMQTTAGGKTEHEAFENLYAKIMEQMSRNNKKLYRMIDEARREAEEEEEFREYIGYLWNHR